MEFTLKEFAESELKNYTVKRNNNIIGVGVVTENSFTQTEIPMLIYKGSKYQYNPNNNDGGNRQGRLLGKVEKKYDVKESDIIEVEGIEFEIKYFIPRIYADFNEFELVMKL
ncbi:hypothetical protein [uncultured Ilyobacter sp.]|uniref:hypothetical protein n=1 Tax=uncultured Ilyobacter sp. TaxID=544433 RepID=UPI0029C8CFEF|nr:hypothetical protein [uncultured Ilyobacter sp.]